MSRKINFVMQPTPNTCVHACLAMVTGEDVMGLVARFGDRALGWEEEACVLVEHGLFPQHMGPVHPNMFPLPGTYLVTTPSLNLLGSAHRVVAVVTEETIQVFDPNEGREGRQFYRRDAILEGDLVAWETTFLNPWALRKMLR